MLSGRRFEQRVTSYLEEPTSVRTALTLIVLATLAVVLGAGVLMWALDHSEYPNIGRGLWWSIQTVTTVGYGDVTPAHVTGRLVGVIVMLWGVAFVSILVAAVTSTFVSRVAERRMREVAEVEKSDAEHAQERFDELSTRLERIEQTLARLTKT